MLASALASAVSAASLNLCTDEYLLLLARPNEIASVSYLSQDPLESPLWRLGRRHHGNHGSVEQVIARRPGLLLTMGGGGRASQLIARRINMRTVDLRPPASLDDVAANLRLVASALDDPARAAPWLLRLAKIRRSAPPKAYDAIFVGGAGRSLRGGSVGTQWLRLAGLNQRPLPDARATLETFLVHPPAVLVESRYRRGQISLGRNWLGHPLVRNAKSRRITTDGRAWTCMGPLLIAEIERLRGLVQ